MNVLILTPDAVGSTLLQRLITIYMQFHEFDRPVVNLHELTNGIERFYSPEFNRELLCKSKTGKNWGYFQSLPRIVEVLGSLDHYKTARLAEYHIKARGDKIEDQIPFYQYLDLNYFIISCRSRNLFEHALSWGLNKISKRLNVYNVDEKVDSFYNLYKNKVNLDLVAFEHSLDRYQSYLTWAENNFTIGSYFYYEDHIDSMERYILDLPIFASQTKKITWKDTYNIDFSDWNRAHYYLSNIGSLALDKPEQFVALPNTNDKDNEFDYLPAVSQNLLSKLPAEQQSHLRTHLQAYSDAQQSVTRMWELGILPTLLPIKKQTLAEKKFMIKNFEECLAIYNRWAAKNPDIADQMTLEDVEESIDSELQKWRASNESNQDANIQLLLPPTD